MSGFTLVSMHGTIANHFLVFRNKAYYKSWSLFYSVFAIQEVSKFYGTLLCLGRYVILVTNRKNFIKCGSGSKGAGPPNRYSNDPTTWS